MSLWFQSLSDCFDDCKSQDDRVLCIVQHLSMPVPRAWWESCMADEKRIPDYAPVLNDLFNEIVQNEKFAWLDRSLLVALAFIDDTKSDQPEFGSVYNRHSLD